MRYEAKLVKASTKSSIPESLHPEIIKACSTALSDHDCFTIALSGGSLPSFLSSISSSFDSQKIDPQFSKWHVCLADERIVPSSSDDNNLKCLREKFLDHVPIPLGQIYGIDEAYNKFYAEDEKSLSMLSQNVAAWYEDVIKVVLAKSGGTLDCAVLGFGPDGHTCSLFPGHDLLEENTKFVACIDDSPKPPPKRITLTFRVLNSTSCVIFCGAGSSKGPILNGIFEHVKSRNDGSFDVTMMETVQFPCGMVRPKDGAVIFVVDSDAATGLECKL